MRPWSIEECEAYAKQLRDKTRANTAEHAAQAIEYLLERLAQPERKWQELTPEEVGALTYFHGLNHIETPLLAQYVRHIEAAIKEKNAP